MKPLPISILDGSERTDNGCARAGAECIVAFWKVITPLPPASLCFQSHVGEFRLSFVETKDLALHHRFH